MTAHLPTLPIVAGDSRFWISSPVLSPKLKFSRSAEKMKKNTKKIKVAKLFPNKISRDKMAYSKQNKTVVRQSKIQRILKGDIVTLQIFSLCYRDQVVKFGYYNETKMREIKNQCIKHYVFSTERGCRQIVCLFI